MQHGVLVSVGYHCDVQSNMTAFVMHLRLPHTAMQRPGVCCHAPLKCLRQRWGSAGTIRPTPADAQCDSMHPTAVSSSDIDQRQTSLLLQCRQRTEIKELPYPTACQAQPMSGRRRWASIQCKASDHRGRSVGFTHCERTFLQASGKRMVLKEAMVSSKLRFRHSVRCGTVMHISWRSLRCCHLQVIT